MAMAISAPFATEKGGIDVSALVRLSLGSQPDDANYSETQDFLARFGTEGSEVQILSPRPIPKENPRNSVCRVTRFLLPDSTVGTEWSVLQIRPSVEIVRDFSPPSPRDRSIRATFRSKALPSTLPDVVVGH